MPRFILITSCFVLAAPNGRSVELVYDLLTGNEVKAREAAP